LIKPHAEVGDLALPEVETSKFLFAARRMRDRSLLPLTFAAIVTGPEMPLVTRKGVLAIAAVIDVAINASARPVSAKALAARHRLPPRHLEPVLQALVRDGILKGIRGPHGGYELARERNRISADDILRAADTVEDADELPLPGSALVNDVVRPALAETERTLSVALARINVDDMVKRAATLK
jgi:Rrf2 family protein